MATTREITEARDFFQDGANMFQLWLDAFEFKEKNAELDAEIKAKKARLAELNQSISDVEGAHSKRVREMDAQIALRSQRISELDGELTERQNLKSRIQDYIDNHLPPLKGDA
jgi:hypothetical protein